MIVSWLARTRRPELPFSLMRLASEFPRSNEVPCNSVRTVSASGPTWVSALFTHSVWRTLKGRRQLNARVTSLARRRSGRCSNGSKTNEADKAPVHQVLRQWPRCPMVNNLLVINLATKRARGNNFRPSSSRERERERERERRRESGPFSRSLLRLLLRLSKKAANIAVGLWP